MTDHAMPAPPAPGFLSGAAAAALALPTTPMQYPALDDPDGWTQLISGMDQMISTMLPTGLPVTSDLRSVNGVPTYVCTPEGAPATEICPVYLSFHGGALIMGGGDVNRQMTEANALVTGIENWSPDYRMPPTHPYPAALDDAIAAYRGLLEVRNPGQIVVGGGSAGGNLAAALLLRAHDEGLPMPAALVLMTPEVDLTESGDSFRTLAYASPGLQTLMQANLLYANGHDLTHPYLSPLFGDVAHFPPTLLVAGTRDLYLSNTVRMHRKLRDAGVNAELHVIDARPHAGFGNAPEEAAVHTEHAAFIRRYLQA